jgi:type III secretory pathway component EscR
VQVLKPLKLLVVVFVMSPYKFHVIDYHNDKSVTIQNVKTL